MSSRPISIVVPVYDEEGTLEPLVDEIRDVAEQHDLSVEIVFVDDGSADASWAKIVELSERFSPDVPQCVSVGGLRFRCNSGKAAALMAGFSAVRQDLVFMMDADLQDPPQEIPRFLKKIDEGYDVVSGWKKIRHDPWHKVYPSRVFNRMIGVLTRVRLHDHVCGFKCLRREIARRLRIFGGFHRFIGVLSAAEGARVTEIPTLHRPRTAGYSKYGFTRFFKGFMDLLAVVFLTRFRYRPEHVLGVAGVVWILVNIVLSLILATLHWFGWMFRLQFSLGVLQLMLLMASPGVILIGLGLMAAANAERQNMEEQYDIVECTGWCARKRSAPAGAL